MNTYNLQITIWQSTTIPPTIEGSGIFEKHKVENGVGELHYLYRDLLGSIVTITDDDGNVEHEQNFDPWGRYRDAYTWNNLNNGLAIDGDQDNDNIADWVEEIATDDWAWFARGYTGHACAERSRSKMLPQFGLINMPVLSEVEVNGRAYDPVLGRMLQVDNYIQNPFSSQSYNPYSYVLNNPLKYVDPEGENPALIVIGIMALAGSYSGAGSVAGFGIGYSTDRIVHDRTHEEALKTGVGLAKYGAAFGAAVGTAYGLSPGGFGNVNPSCKVNICKGKHFGQFPTDYPRFDLPKLFKPVKGVTEKWLERTYWSTTTSDALSTSAAGVLRYALPNAPLWLGSEGNIGPWIWRSAGAVDFNMSFTYPGGSNPTVNLLNNFYIPWGGFYQHYYGIDISFLYQRRFRYSRSGWSFFWTFNYLETISIF